MGRLLPTLLLLLTPLAAATADISGRWSGSMFKLDGGAKQTATLAFTRNK